MILVLSDLHLDYAIQSEKKKLEKLVLEFANPENTIVINGDLFDSPAREKPLGRQLEDILSLLLKACKMGAKIYIVAGNHDLGINSFVGKYLNGQLSIVYPDLKLKLGKKVIFFEHGHRYDPLFKHSIYDLMRILEEKGNFQFGDLAEEALTKLQGFFQSRQTKEFGVPEEVREIFREGAAKAAKKERLDVVVFGHTHSWEVTEIGPGTYYFNCGSWYKNLNYGLISDSKISVYSIKGKKAILLKELDLT